MEKKIIEFEITLSSGMKEMEKKITTDRNDVETVRKDFKKFQAKFLDFDKKVEKINETMNI